MPATGSERKRQEAYNESAVDLLQDLFLVQRHGLASPLLYPLLLQHLTGVHLPRGADLTCTHLRRERSPSP